MLRTSSLPLTRVIFATRKNVPGSCKAIMTLPLPQRGRVPLVLKQEIYATAAVLGGIAYWLLTSYLQQPLLASASCVAIVTLLRIMAIEKGWKLPTLN